MQTIDLPQGTVRYRVAGPEDASTPPVVFVHGFLVNHTLWTGVADALARAGVRSYAPDWPLGSHRVPMNDSADQSPRGVARHILAFLEAMDLDDVTIVGNDSGGALTQFVLDTDARRIGRVVLTNCDTFEHFPPAPFNVIFKPFRYPAVVRAAMPPLRIKAVRHSAAGFGLLVDGPLDAAQTLDWVEPTITDAGIRRDTARFVASIDPQELVGVSNRMGAFDGPALLVWGNADRFFKIEHGRQLRDVFTDARLVEVEGGRTFLPLDEPQRVADEIVSFVAETQGAKTV
jgi:pimeloyl-ACP methyl ester carboxylesterase